MTRYEVRQPLPGRMWGLSPEQAHQLSQLELRVTGGKKLTQEQLGLLRALRLLGNHEHEKRADVVLEKHRAMK